MTLHGKLCAIAASLLVVSAGAAYSYQSSRAVAPNRDLMKTILAAAHENRTKCEQSKDEDVKQQLDTDLRPILLRARLGLQELTASRGDQIHFSRVVLNTTNTQFDAIRFRTPGTGEDFDLRVEIVVPGNAGNQILGSWGLIGVEGPSPALEDFSRRDNFELPSSGFPEENFAITPYVRGGNLRSNGEYILWMNLRSDQTSQAYIKIGIKPTEESAARQFAATSKARNSFQSAQRTLNQKYDTELKNLRKTYTTELDKVAKTPEAKADAVEASRIVAEGHESVRRDPELPDRRGFQILSAKYGIDSRWIDVTDELKPLMRGNLLRFGLGTDFSFKTDPAYGVVKRLVIVYTIDGNPGVSITADKQRVELPPTAPILDRIPFMGSYKH